MMTPEEKRAAHTAYMAVWRERNKEKVLAGQRTNYAANRDRVLAHRRSRADEINARRRAKYAEDPDRYREARRRWGQENPEKLLEQRRRFGERRPDYRHEWLRANPGYASATKGRRRAREWAAGSDLTLEQYQAILAEHDFSCRYCGDRPARLSLDHATPLARGGRHAASNVVPACLPCNLRKGTKTAAEFLRVLYVSA